jgi:hypothetical protein
MKTFHSLITGFRPARLVFVRQIAFPLLVLVTGLMLLQPCSGARIQFELTGSLTYARANHTATLLPNGKVLAAGGHNVGLENLASAELYDLANGTWTGTGSLAIARQQHTATLLSNGKVLVVGGLNNSVPLASAELYDPASGSWSPTGSLVTARRHHTATLLPDGKVLVAGGGENGADYLASAELYDPVYGTWTTTGSLNTPRRGQTATLLPNGKVLVAGGAFSTAVLKTAELYDPASGTWLRNGSLLAFRRSLHTATLLPNGEALIVGGFNGYQFWLESAELGTWTDTASLARGIRGRYDLTATLLSKVHPAQPNYRCR